MVVCYQTPPRPHAVNVAFIRVIFHPEIAAEFSQTSLEVDTWRPIANAYVSAAGFWPCRQAVPPRRLPAQAACPALGFFLFQVFGHPQMDALVGVSTPHRPNSPGATASGALPLMGFVAGRVLERTDVPHRLLLPVTS